MNRGYSERVNFRTQDLVISSLLVALVFISTRSINIRLPISVNGGLIHLGTAMLFIAAIVFGKNKGAIAGAFGMGIFDILSGWAAWAPFTFIIRAVMGYIVGTFAYMGKRNGGSFIFNFLGILLSSLWMIAGYYIAEVIMYGNLLAPVTSIPGNVVQIVVGAVIALPISTALKKTKMF
ncbi:MAG: ECF transporter S component [Caulobacteraceae bacterium]